MRMIIESITILANWEHERTKRLQMSTTSMDHLSRDERIKPRKSCMARIRQGLVVPSHVNKDVLLNMSMLSQSELNTNMD